MVEIPLFLRVAGREDLFGCVFAFMVVVQESVWVAGAVWVAEAVAPGFAMGGNGSYTGVCREALQRLVITLLLWHLLKSCW